MSSRITVSGSVTATIPVSTSTVATPIVPCPHIGRQPETSMKSTPQSASGRVEGCRIAPDIARVAARLAHQQPPQVVALGLEVQLAVEHRGAGERADPAGDDPGRHALRVGVDGGEDARRPQAGTCCPRSAPSAASSTARSSPVSSSRGGRHGPPARPTASCAALKNCTSFGVMSSRASGSSRV